MSEFPTSFKSHLIQIPSPINDPTLSLKIHALHFKPSSARTRPILLLHGHPQNHRIWRHVADALVKQSNRNPDASAWEIIIPDLRGHGDSEAPPAIVELGAPNEQVGKERYSKREMGKDMFEVMKHFGHTEGFDILAHDRGARVAHRMSLDEPSLVKSMILLDIAPTLDLYEKADSRFASMYWHWYFLIQPYPMPEQLILGSPSTYLSKLTEGFPSANLPASTSIFSDQAFASYLSQMSNLPQVSATCSDYRASAPGGPDLTLDTKDRKDGKGIQCRTRILWGKKGVNELLFGDRTLELWKNCCVDKSKCTGKGLNGGHYLPEDSWEEILGEVESFFGK